ncbi:twin-arginine translocation signal domain-containing protein (plasmid) [Haloferax mediterranei ATCC 33500]|uniref:Twin-arginine translocation signal domain-containing protein n=1 Tax=Haloferax mediterranei (strain ATCC 33500 / DSM 1411 / JCM 8866 / NBRC 14739 / NCIMB 2177 / R-4) TaxID=523841 RepID=I3RBC0_HALMT|nr:twin-arginine translocation signal domain-containing protein [Haloferax mediterranei]AFK21530.1 hypothetical protein HFX_6411 [Haloferax mediterranei ATCC 33500]AHZ24417.1 hypothetical protein BM92_15985 [Haloferax mediterranei ATCC 33500]ELZ97157.1 hypothetical protein C439_17583 [Haloferax mediterranei ATCC 33500]MDX5990099.1 twin-arginine translocation signal domain-containing protein [Haloferax mediterranei ATCC 33500]QCQ76816.1 twin-arginine translocation signal domain-containing prote
MSRQTRRSFLQKSAIATVGLGTLATGSAAAGESETELGDEVVTGHADSGDIHVADTGEVTVQASWPFGRDFDNLAPGKISAVSTLAIVEGAYYDFDVSYSPELPIGLCFIDLGTNEYYAAEVSSSGNYRYKSPVGIPEDSAAVGILNKSDNSRDISGDFSVDN